MRKLISIWIAALLVFSIVGFAQQSHPLKEIVPLAVGDSNLQLYNYSIVNASQLHVNSIYNRTGGVTRTISLIDTISNIWGLTLAAGGFVCTSCIDTDDIASVAVTLGKLASNSVDSSKIVDGGVQTADIGNSQVTNAKIANPSVTLNSGAGISISGGSLSLGGSATITNAGVTSLQGSTGALSLSPGTGISISGLTIANSGDTNAADDVLISTNHAGDISGTYNNLQLGSGVVGSNEVNSGQVQLRVSGSCAAGNSIRIIASDGTVTCEPDDSGGVTGSGTADRWTKWSSSSSLTDAIPSDDGTTVNFRNFPVTGITSLTTTGAITAGTTLSISQSATVGTSLTVSGTSNIGWERSSTTGCTSNPCTRSCSSGKKLLSGGCGTDGTLTSNQPSSDTTWHCGRSGGTILDVTVICARVGA